MFDSDISHYLTDRVVDGQNQIYIGRDNGTGKPMLAVPCVRHALVGACYYELSEDEYKLARANLPEWYARIGSKMIEAA